MMDERVSAQQSSREQAVGQKVDKIAGALKDIVRGGEGSDIPVEAIARALGEEGFETAQQARQMKVLEADGGEGSGSPESSNSPGSQQSAATAASMTHTDALGIVDALPRANPAQQASKAA